MTEDVGRGTGKWRQAGVPKRGWECVDWYDNKYRKDLRAVCEMCEVQEIRFVHVMEHNEYPDRLHCGCDCAGYMEENYVRAKNRERKGHRRAARRKTFVGLQAWQRRGDGNYYIEYVGARARVLDNQGGEGYEIEVTPADTPTKTHRGKRIYPTEKDAKLACFDYLMWLEDHYTSAAMAN